MPRVVRNWWVTGKPTNYDGYSEGNLRTFGPSTKGGGFEVKIQQRDAGQVTTALEVWGIVTSEGKLRLQVNGPDGKSLLEYETER